MSFQPGGTAVLASKQSTQPAAAVPDKQFQRADIFQEPSQKLDFETENVSPNRVLLTRNATEPIDGIMNRAMDELDRLSVSVVIKADSG